MSGIDYGNLSKELDERDIALISQRFLATLNSMGANYSESPDSTPRWVNLSNMYKELSLGAYDLNKVIPFILDNYLVPNGLVLRDDTIQAVRITDKGMEINSRINRPGIAPSEVISLIQSREVEGSTSSFSSSFSKESFTTGPDNGAPLSQQRGRSEVSDKETSEFDKILPTYVTNDKWTTEDKLGYHAYAYSLAKFITAKETDAPLCISIQAPWGGGKTSLMRMIQRMLDSKAPEYLDKSEPSRQTSPTVGQVIDELKDKSNKKSKEPPVIEEPKSFDESKLESRITVWFNAWKYENSDQVWAGLADSIVKGIADRLDPVERQWFYLRLNLRRLDKDSIRSWIVGRVWQYSWKYAAPWAIGGMVGLAASTLVGIGGISNLFISIPSFSVATTSGGVILAKLFEGRSKITNEAADMALDKFVRVPDYNEKLGFIHRVKHDLDLVFESLPKKEQFRRLVIFIDDLDRCSPDNVAQVIEGINLFLAGEFQGCIFVIGMDSEMVSAALEVAHEKVISKLPSYASQTPLGWRFMDKFVQLPIIIPPSMIPTVRKYADGLLESHYTPVLKNSKALQNSDAPTMKSQSESVKDTFLNQGQKEDIDKMYTEIETMSDTDISFRNEVSQAAAEFSNNPREIKRFVNSLRFYRFLMTFTHKNANNNDFKLSFSQVRRWIVLSLKWPQLVRWLYSDSGVPEESLSNSSEYVGEKLRSLENIAGLPQDKWDEKFTKLLTLQTNEHTPMWIRDQIIRKFFYRESTEYQHEPLSSGAGLGVY